MAHVHLHHSVTIEELKGALSDSDIILAPFFLTETYVVRRRPVESAEPVSEPRVKERV